MKIIYDQKQLIPQILATSIIEAITEHIQKDQKLLIALSGGSTPVHTYKVIAEHLANLPMDPSSFVYITQIDERFVDSESKRSNRRMIQDVFGDLVTYDFIPHRDEVDSLENAVALFARRLNRRLHHLGKSGIDISILGMGTDGHTASLFPENQAFLDSRTTDLSVIGVLEETVPEPRISMTAHVINQSRKKYLLFFGEDKAKVFKQALDSNDEEKHPILTVLNNCVVYTDQNIVMD